MSMTEKQRFLGAMLTNVRSTLHGDLDHDTE
jgi:hypothetical protein